MDNSIINKAKEWLSESFDVETQNEVRCLLENDEPQLIDSFYKDLEFGTGGLRGIMGVGTNRMNKYTVARATQGLANYLLKIYDNNNMDQIRCIVAYDSRNNSRLFADTVIDVLSANGIYTFWFHYPTPTPTLSYSVRELKCKCGIVITASHNPKEYNGYKVYWKDGGQIISPHDKEIMKEINAITDFSQIKFNPNYQKIHLVAYSLTEKHIGEILKFSKSIHYNEKKDLKIAYTPIHGSAGATEIMMFRLARYFHFKYVDAQWNPDGNFPTVNTPNPEDPAALEMVIDLAKKEDSDIIFATDPDGDRLGVGVKDKNGNYVLLNGNQTASILTYFILSQLSEKQQLKENDYIVKTIVTTELLIEIAKFFKVNYYEVLTGFKYIAEIIEKNYEKARFLCGGEESYGFLAGEFVRDKDAVLTSFLVAEMAIWAKKQNKNLLDILTEIYLKFGFYKEGLLSITKQGKEGLEEIEKIMVNFRNNPPKKIINQNIIEIFDYQKSEKYDMINNTKSSIDIPQSNVLQFVLEDKTKITIRPSGTEPKIKFYITTNEKLENVADYEKINCKLTEKIEKIFMELK